MISTIILAITCVINLGLGGLVLTRNPRSASGRIFFVISVLICLWATSNYIAGTTGITIRYNDLANRVASMLGFLVVAEGAWFTYNFSPQRRAGIITRAALILASLVISCLSVTDLVSGKVTLLRNGSLAYSVGGLSIVYVAAIIAMVGLIFANLMHVAKRGKGKERQQALLIAAAFIVPTILGLTTNELLPILVSSWSFAGIGPISTVFLVGTITYAMTRHQLFDIHLFVLRAAAYLSTLFIVTFVFVAPFVVLISRLIGGTLPLNSYVLLTLLSVGLLYLLQYLKRFFDSVTARLFLRNIYDPQNVLDELGDVLVRSANLNKMQQNTASILQKVLKSDAFDYLLFATASREDLKLIGRINEYCAANKLSTLIVDEMVSSHDLQRQLRAREISLAVRLHTAHEDLGFMLLGHKQSGELYAERDFRLLNVAADEIAISLQNALRFEQIQRFNVTLQEEVDSATAKLRRTNKRLEELDSIKDDFISMASHQLRTPLTSVKGYLSMVLEGDAGSLNETQAQMLKQAFNSSQRMVFLITDLLNVSRLKTGKFVIEPVPVNLSDVVEQELEQLKETAALKNLELIYDKPARFPQLMLDEVKIRQVIMNFVDNAIYYTPQDGHIRVELIEKPSAVELRVIDDGIGVPKGEQHHLFTKFYRATNARKARPDGTGLGLFMAQKVITAQGGSIIFSSHEGKGSTFGFTFSKSHLAASGGAHASVPVVAPKPPKTTAKTRVAK